MVKLISLMTQDITSIIPIVTIGFAFFVLTVAQNLYIEAKRRDILNSIQQFIPVGCMHLVIKADEWKYPTLWWRVRHYRAEVIFTEKCVFCFYYLRFFWLLKAFYRFDCLYATNQDIPNLWRDKSKYFMYVHTIDGLKIDGRQVVIEFETSRLPFFGRYLKLLGKHHFELEDVRDNDAYRNLLRLHRHRYEMLHQEEMQNGR